MDQVSSYTSWQPLEEVIVGKAYTPDYFDFMDNAQVRDQLQQILAETNEDLDNLQKTCEKYGVWVEKSMYGRKYFGIERTTLLINKEAFITKIWNKVKVTNHVEEVIEFIEKN